MSEWKANWKAKLPKNKFDFVNNNFCKPVKKWNKNGYRIELCKAVTT